MKEIRSFLINRIQFVTALDSIKCLKQISACSLCATCSELPSNISTMLISDAMIGVSAEPDELSLGSICPSFAICKRKKARQKKREIKSGSEKGRKTERERKGKKGENREKIREKVPKLRTNLEIAKREKNKTEKKERKEGEIDSCNERGRSREKKIETEK